MTKLLTCCFFIAYLLSTSVQADDSLNGATLYSQNCMTCHGGGQAMHERVAPPIVAVKNHYVAIHDEEGAFVNALIEWVQNPVEERTLMPGAIRKFGLMPAQSLSNEEIAAIAAFIFNESMEKPGWYDKHFKEEHGSK